MKKYGNLTAVDNLSLRVEAGEVFGFLGPNSAGKTTTIKMLTGLLVPTSGRATICGVDVQADPVKVKSVLGFVPDTPDVYERLTAGAASVRLRLEKDGPSQSAEEDGRASGPF